MIASFNSKVVQQSQSLAAKTLIEAFIRSLFAVRTANTPTTARQPALMDLFPVRPALALASFLESFPW